MVRNQPPKEEDTLVHYLLKNEAKNKSFAYPKETGKALLSELSYRTLAHSDKYFLLEINPHTGRHHQIRAQLSAIGSPIKGDLKYGFDRTVRITSIETIL